MGLAWAPTNRRSRSRSTEPPLIGAGQSPAQIQHHFRYYLLVPALVGPHTPTSHSLLFQNFRFGFTSSLTPFKPRAFGQVYNGPRATDSFG